MRQPAKSSHQSFTENSPFASHSLHSIFFSPKEVNEKNVESINYVEFRFQSNLAVVWWCDWFKSRIFWCVQTLYLPIFGTSGYLMQWIGLVDIIFRFYSDHYRIERCFAIIINRRFRTDLISWPATTMYGRMSSANFMHIIFISCTLFFVATGQRNHVRITFVVSVKQKKVHLNWWFSQNISIAKLCRWRRKKM